MKRIGRVLFAALVILLLTVFLYSAWNIYSIWHEYKKAERHYDSLSETVVAASVPRPSASPAAVAPPEKEEAPAPRWSEFSPVSVDFDELTALCADMVGWLYLPDTVINYPVVQGTDNDYYLNRFYDGKPNVGGTLFVDYVCPGDFSGANTIIYGHNMKNGSMFAVLNRYAEQSFYDEHPVLYLNTPAQNYKVEFFTGFVSDPEGMIYTAAFPSDTAYGEFLDEIRSRSCFVSPVTVTTGDRILTLSTCSTSGVDMRFVLVGKLTEIG